jgi:predicted nucleotidyltransferase component of viral defense system
VTRGQSEPQLLREDIEAFDVLRDAAADHHGLPPGIVEKDYWATEILRSATRPLEGATELVFKGGTSLSKAFDIIQRFSEDVDLLVVTELTGNPLKRLLRSIADRATERLGPQHQREREGRGYLNARYSYPTRASVNILAEGVLLEMGCRGGPLPNQRRVVESLLALAAEHVAEGSRAEYSDLAPFEVTVLAPERTLAEKLAFVHHRASTRQLEQLRGGARHFYDIYQLLNDSSTVAVLQGGTMAELMVDVDRRSEIAGWSYTPRPSEGFAASPAFGDDAEVIGALRQGYVQIRQLLWGDVPDFDHMLSFIREQHELL